MTGKKGESLGREPISQDLLERITKRKPTY
jgi:hypothetical protein